MLNDVNAMRTMCRIMDEERMRESHEVRVEKSGEGSDDMVMRVV